MEKILKKNVLSKTFFTLKIITSSIVDIF